MASVIAIGSTRRPKVEAVRAAFAKIIASGSLALPQVQFIAYDVPSQVANTPMSQKEMMQGAYHRVQSVLEQTKHSHRPRFVLGLEGGLFSLPSPQEGTLYFLQSWVYASDGTRGAYGASPAVQIPPAIAEEITDSQVELAHVMDRLTRRRGVRDKGGAFAVLTNGLLTRQMIFEHAVLAAMAPFYRSPFSAP